MRRSGLPVVCVLVAAFAASGCGGGSESSGAGTVNWYVFNEPGGAYDAAVATCNKQADGLLQDQVRPACPPTPTSSAS